MLRTIAGPSALWQGARRAARGAGALAAAVGIAGAQESSRKPATGWEFVGLPALNFTTDEGFGYGVLAEIYNYGDGVQPYRYSIQPTVFLTTKGRRDVILFFDAPQLLPRGWRFDAQLAREQQLATPYFGVGNATPHVDALEAPPNPYYYRLGRVQFRLNSNLQHRIGSRRARVLFGVGFLDATVDATPFDSGTTLLATELGSRPAPEGRVNFVRAGLVWDTRDREIGPNRGLWADVLVQRVDEALGASSSYTRVTLSARKYMPIGARLVNATRLVLQQADGNVPLFDLHTMQTSFKPQEGLGGNNSLRGIPKNRFIGKGLALANAELRWRAHDFGILGKPAFLLLSGFVDAGRVWAGSMRVGEIASDLHVGYGGGVRIGLGPSFVVAVDVGRSSESAQLYIGLGYPY